MGAKFWRGRDGRGEEGGEGSREGEGRPPNVRDALTPLPFTQHSDKKNGTLKPTKNPFDDCDETELHRSRDMT